MIDNAKISPTTTLQCRDRKHYRW